MIVVHHGERRVWVRWGALRTREVIGGSAGQRPSFSVATTKCEVRPPLGASLRPRKRSSLSLARFVRIPLSESTLAIESQSLWP
ncbi:hypothetical protein M404DRAFT_440357 [Pisolithus tinctorius Marx 270]|uniref:Uncharacterized protein n=1 Tax=Pisolithus tinctorius Marx 270 TaxID=870435 RepID=A0A0C3P0Z5_PISTI|nr:hypothetical protein M404DRAFT_440357 [Pisolithus tinctorius Marx 270]